MTPAIDLPHVHSGKVRDIFDAGDGLLLMVTSDRISAFDVVMAEPIPDKGRVLTAMSAFWFDLLADVVPGHLLSIDLDDVTGLLGGSVPDPLPADLAGRTMLCRKAEMLPIECIVRGYITGSAWKEYRSSGTMHGSPMPEGLRESDRLPEPVFTPSTKADEGHDENISFEQAVEIEGREVAEKVRDLSLQIYTEAREYARERGIIIADTKFEFGVKDEQVLLIDEVLTPDSSRFWPQELYQPGQGQPSFDKQFVRDWLSDTGWNKEPPAPELPADIVEKTIDRYSQALERQTGQSIEL